MSVAELAAIDKEYQDNFANRPRLTRSLPLLDGLMARVKPLTSAGGEVGDTATKLLDSYGKERQLISELQGGGANANAAHRANALNNALTRRYERHYAGQNRLSRDHEMLREIGDRMDVNLGQMNTVATRWDHDVFVQSRARHAEFLGSVRSEIQAIGNDFPTGTVEQKAQALATRANHQFRWYRLCFAGKDRASRRLPLLERMIRELEWVHGQMNLLVTQGLNNEQHNNNIATVEGSLNTWRNERVAVLNARPRLDDQALFKALAAEANGLFDRYRNEYRAKERKGLDPSGLVDTCDALLEVALQMDETDRLAGNNAYEKNIFTVLENLALYERELVKIREANAPS